MKKKLDIIKDGRDTLTPADLKAKAEKFGEGIMSDIWRAVTDALQEDRYKNKNFYVCLFLNRHPNKKIKETMVRPFVRLSCPTPHYSMAVWKYHAIASDLEFLWMLPNKPMAYYLVHNYPHIPPHRMSMAHYSYLALTGKLLEFAEQENGNKPNAIIHIANA